MTNDTKALVEYILTHRGVSGSQITAIMVAGADAIGERVDRMLELARTATIPLEQLKLTPEVDKLAKEISALTEARAASSPLAVAKVLRRLEAA